MALNTYTDLQDAVLGWLARPGDALVAPAVPDMVRLFEAEATRRLKTGAAEKQAVVTTAAGAPSVDLPADFGQLRQASIQGRPLTYVTPSSLPGLTGLPFAHTLWGQTKMWLGPAPDTVYDIEILYQTGVPPLGPANPTNWLLEQAPDAYLFGVLVEAELYIGHDERVQTWAARREAAFASIEQADRKARWGGPLTIQVDGITMPPGGGGGGSGGGSAMSAVFVGDLPPPNPNPGALWWCSTDGQLYFFYIDPSGPPGQWTAATNLPGAAGAGTGPVTGPGSITTVTPVSGDTVVVEPETPSIYIASPALAALTIKLWPAPAVGDTVQLCFAAPVTALAIQDSAGGAIAGAPTSAYGPGAAIIMRYRSGTWTYWK